MISIVIPVICALTMMDGWMDEMDKQRTGSQEKYIGKKICWDWMSANRISHHLPNLALYSLNSHECERYTSDGDERRKLNRLTEWLKI